MLGTRPPQSSTDDNDMGTKEGTPIKDLEERPWVATLTENRKNWKALCLPTPKAFGNLEFVL